MQQIRVLVIEGNPLFRKGLVAILAQEPGMEVVADLGDAESAFAALKELRPEVALIDLDVLEGEAGCTITQIRTAVPSMNIVVLSATEGDDEVFAAVKGGAKGFLLKDAQVEDLVQAVRLAALDQGFICPSITAKFLNRLAALDTGGGSREQRGLLTKREKHILRLVAMGESNREIALMLMISEHTVKVHLRNIFGKLELHNRQEATAYAYRQRLVPILSLSTLVAGSLVVLAHVPCFAHI